MVTDAPCAELRAVGISAGMLDELDGRDFDTVTQACSGEGEVGTLVLLPPSPNEEAPFAFKVVASLGGDISACARPRWEASCIEVRRAMRFTGHESYHVPVRLSVACAGVRCPDGQTCDDGVCHAVTLPCTGPDDCEPPPQAAGTWERPLGGVGQQMGRQLAVAAHGTLALTGNFDAAFDPGGGAPLTPTAGVDAFVASYTRGGELRWARGLGGAGRDEGLAVAFDGDELYTLVAFDAPINLGGGPLPADPQGSVALARFSAVGALRWAIAFPGNGVALATSADGDALVAGSFTGSITLAGQALSAKGGADAFVARFTKDGELRWARAFGGTGDEHANAVAVDAAGQVYFAGAFSGEVDPGAGPTLVSKGGADAFVAALDEGGAPRWALGFGAVTNDDVFGLAVQGDRLVLTGALAGPAVIAGLPLSTQTGGGFVAALDRAGKGAWALPFGDGAGRTAGRSVAFAADGAVLLGGVLGEGSAFGTEPISSKGPSSPFVAVLAPEDGAPRWARAYPAGDFGDLTGLGAGDGGYVYLAGWHTGSLGGVTPPLVSGGAEDAFLLRVAPP